MIDDEAKSDADESPRDSKGTSEVSFLTFKRWLKQDKKHRDKWIDSAKEAFDYVAGKQWSDEDLQKLRDQMRPAMTFNRIAPMIDAVVGTEITNRHEVNYIPRTQGDEPVNEVLTQAARFVRDQCDADHEESNAFRDAVICGEGWTETRLDYDENPDGDIQIDRINPLEMYVDSAARKANYKDARRVWRIRVDIPIEEARDMFPDFSDWELNAKWASVDSQEDEEARDTTPPRYQDDASDEDEKSDGKCVTLVQCQWFEKEDYYRGVMLDPMTGQQEETKLTPAEHKMMLKRAPEAGRVYKAVKQRRKVYRQAWIGNKVLESGPLPCDDHFTFNAITGKLDSNSGHFYGMVRAMKDPQEWANKWLSQALHILNSQAKGGVIAESGVAEDDQEFEDSYTAADAITFVKPGALSNPNGPKFQAKPQGSFPPQLTQLMEFAITSLRDVTGVNAEILGQRDANQPASLEYQRRQAGTTILAAFFDSLRLYRKVQGRVLMYMITKYISDGRLIRIVGEENAQYAPLTKQPENIQYDVIVDESPSSPNQKDQTWAIMQPMLPVILKMGVPSEVIMEVLKASPLPASTVASITKAMKTPPPPPPPDPKVEQMKLQAEMDMQAKQTDAQLQASIAEKQLELRRTEAEMSMAIEAKKAETELALMTQKATIERDLKILDFQLKQQQAEQARQDSLMADARNAEREDAARMYEAQRSTATEAKPDHTEAMAGAMQALATVVGQMNKPKVARKGPDGAFRLEIEG